MPSRGMKFIQAGTIHRAQWIARAIYAINLCLFKNQFVTTKKVLSPMKKFSLFIVQIYVYYWFKVPIALAVPPNGLNLLKQQSLHSDEVVAQAAILKFLRHQWYLSYLLICLSILDPNVSWQVKKNIVIALNMISSKKCSKSYKN